LSSKTENLNKIIKKYSEINSGIYMFTEIELRDDYNRDIDYIQIASDSILFLTELKEFSQINEQIQANIIFYLLRICQSSVDNEICGKLSSNMKKFYNYNKELIDYYIDLAGNILKNINFLIKNGKLKLTQKAKNEILLIKQARKYFYFARNNYFSKRGRTFTQFHKGEFKMFFEESKSINRTDQIKCLYKLFYRIEFPYSKIEYDESFYNRVKQRINYVLSKKSEYFSLFPTSEIGESHEKKIKKWKTIMEKYKYIQGFDINRYILKYL